ncbi:sigma factor-like helix-turn-helix DNA-binding protein [Sphingomonas sp. ST-64]|uniref:Sigma factor-like helix-turn-helix DNA-binding protein n=1 Tax=Sphingomonas plantiphila TaxID=3163295 RepID=A0ABW8YHY6_9SPHN
MSHNKQRQGIYGEVTARVIADLEKGRLPWVQPRDSARCGCAATGRRYSGTRCAREGSVAALALRVAAALPTMAPLPRAVFDRHRYRGMTYDAIAEELGISVDEVEHALASAMLHLRRCTDADDGS